MWNFTGTVNWNRPNYGPSNSGISWSNVQIDIFNSRRSHPVGLSGRNHIVAVTPMKFLPMEEFQKRQKSIDPSSKALADTYLKKLANIAGRSNTNVRHLVAPVLDTQEKVEN